MQVLLFRPIHHSRQGLVEELRITSGRTALHLQLCRHLEANVNLTWTNPKSPLPADIFFPRCETQLHVGQWNSTIFGFAKVLGSSDSSDWASVEKVSVQCRLNVYSQKTWAPALEWRLASMMVKASCSSLISFSLFSSRKDTRESLMSTTSSICWRMFSSSTCCSGVLSTRWKQETNAHA